MVADELAEAQRRLRRLEEEIAGLQDARVVAADRAKAASAAVVDAFNSAAERIEGITRKLNATVATATAWRLGERGRAGRLPPSSSAFAAAFARQGIMTTIGASLVAVREGEVEIGLAILALRSLSSTASFMAAW